MKEFLWMAYFLGQVLSYGNMNYQQDVGYYEINPIYSLHPSSKEILAVKACETIVLYGATRLFPTHEEWLLVGANTFVWGFIAYDRNIGINFKFRW